MNYCFEAERPRCFWRHAYRQEARKINWVKTSFKSTKVAKIIFFCYCKTKRKRPIVVRIFKIRQNIPFFTFDPFDASQRAAAVYYSCEKFLWKSSIYEGKHPKRLPLLWLAVWAKSKASADARKSYQGRISLVKFQTKRLACVIGLTKWINWSL